MKKILCFVLVSALLLCAFLPSVGAAVINEPVSSMFLNDDGLVNEEYYPNGYCSDAQLKKQRPIEIQSNNNLILTNVDRYIKICCNLKEQYYHFDDRGNVDWLVFSCSTYRKSWWSTGFLGTMNFMINEGEPFLLEFGVYDVEEDKFYDALKAYQSEKYEDLGTILSTVDCATPFIRIGDVDGDRIITINDVTLIQKYIAKLIEYPETDTLPFVGKKATIYIYGSKCMVEYIAYISDFNHDGKRDILDATAVQQYIARVPVSIWATTDPNVEYSYMKVKYVY